MYENKIITEPKWKSWVIQTTTPLFTPDQCRQIIECGRSQPPQKAQVGMGKPGGGTDTSKRVTTISWIPFKEMQHILLFFLAFVGIWGRARTYRQSQETENAVWAAFGSPTFHRFFKRLWASGG